MKWTEEKYTELETLHKQNLSWTTISQIMGVTRNAVAGACWRRGLFRSQGKVKRGRRTPEQRIAARLKQSQRIVLPPPAPAKVVVEIIDFEIPLTQRKTLIELDPRKHCRWPVNDPRDGNFFYCGAEKAEGKVYCDCHMRRAHRPSLRNKPGGKGGLQANNHKRKEDAVAFS